MLRRSIGQSVSLSVSWSVSQFVWQNNAYLSPCVRLKLKRWKTSHGICLAH